MKIAVLDDDITILQMIEQAIKGGANPMFDAECRFFTSGFDMLAAVKESHFDVLILDRRLPDMDGDVILQWVRQYGIEKHGAYTSVLMLTSLAREADELTGLMMGADDYVVKPFKPALLIQRVHRLNDRAKQLQSIGKKMNMNEPSLDAALVQADDVFHEGNEFKSCGYVFSQFKRSVRLPSGEGLGLARLDFDLGVYFFKNVVLRLSREAIIENVWRGAITSTRSLDTYVHRLRVKLALAPEKGFDLRTIYGFGYCLYVDSAANGSVLDDAI